MVVAARGILSPDGEDEEEGVDRPERASAAAARAGSLRTSDASQRRGEDEDDKEEEEEDAADETATVGSQTGDAEATAGAELADSRDSIRGVDEPISGRRCVEVGEGRVMSSSFPEIKITKTKIKFF